MEAKPMTVVGVYPTRIGAECAIDAFRDAGFQSMDISLLLPEKMIAEDLFIEEATMQYEGGWSAESESMAMDGPLGWLDDIAPTTAHGAGALVAAGPIGEVLGDLSRISGSLGSALIALGIPAHESAEYEAKVVQGDALLCIHCDNEEDADRARQVHCDVGGLNIFSAALAGATHGNSRYSLYRRVGG